MKLSRLFILSTLLLISLSTGAADLIYREEPTPPETGAIDLGSINKTPVDFVVGNAYVMYNVDCGMYFYRGNAWGTQASGSEDYALLVRFVESDVPGSLWLRDWVDRVDHQTWRTAFITTTDNRAASIGMQAALFVDNSDGPRALMKVTDMGNKIYRISVSDKNTATTDAGISTIGTYFAIDSSLSYDGDGMGGNAINPIATAGNINWQFYAVPEWTQYFKEYDVYEKSEELRATIYKAEALGVNVNSAVSVYNNMSSTVAQMDAAIESLKTLMSYVVNPGTSVTNSWFENCDFSNQGQGWTIGKGTCNFRAGIAEAYGKEFDIHQDFTPAKKGVYQLNLQGFFRTGRGNSALNSYYNGQQTCDAGVYLGTAESVNKTKLACVFSEQIDPDYTYGYDFSADGSGWNDGNYYANTMEDAAVCFNAGMYTATAYGIVKNEYETIRIGVGGKLGGSDWICWDNFDLIFLGYEDANANAFLLQQALDDIDTSKPMGKTVYADVQTAIANGQAAINSGNATRMFQALSAIYELNERIEASVAIFAELTNALEKLLYDIESSSNTTAVNEANAFIQKVQQGVAAHNYDDEDVPALLVQVKVYRTKLYLPADYAGASSKNPVDMTAIIVNPNFDDGYGNNSTEGWNAEGSGYGVGDNNITALALEFYEKIFDLNQTIYGLPNGFYQLQVSAFERTSNPAYLYASSAGNVAQTELQPLAAEDGIDGPAAGVIAFEQGRYINIVVVEVTDGTLTIGIKKTANSTKDWVLLDSFRLAYLGTVNPSTPVITFADANVKALCVANWDTDGDGELSEEEAAAVTDLGEVFKDNKNITSFDELQYFTGLTAIGDNAFYGCYNLRYVTIPNGVTTIGYYAFYGCSGLSSVTIPNSVTSIGYEAFFGCSSLTSIEVESGNTIYDSRNGCNAIIETETGKLLFGCMNTVIPDGVTSIEAQAFRCCTGLTSVTIPNSVMSIGFAAFYCCSNLYNVRIPNCVTKIGTGAFYGCSNLYDVTIPESVERVGVYAFTETGWYFNQPDGLIYLDSWLLGYKGEKPTGNLYINEPIRGIADNAFSDCDGLTSVDIVYGNLTTIGSSAFSDCSSLTRFEIPYSVTIIGQDAFKGTGWYNNYPYSILYLDNWLLGYKGKLPTSDICIAEGTRNMAEFAFDQCFELTSVTLPGSMTSIACSAFYYCRNLKHVTIPSSVWGIKDYAFEGCSNLASVTVERKTPISINATVFQGSNLPNATLYVPYGCKAAYEEADYWKEFKEIVELPLKGDLNRDNMVDILDAVYIINVIAGKVTDADMVAEADVNGDGCVSITDCVATIDLMAAQLSRGDLMAANSRGTTNLQSSISTSDFINATMQDNRLTVALDNERGYTAFQMVVTVPEGMTIGNITMDKTRGTDHIALVRNLGNGQYLVAGFSASNSVLNGNSGSLLSITTDGQATGDIVVSNVTFVTPETEGYRLADAVAGTTTGIDDLQIDNLRFDSDGGSQIVNRKSVNSKCYDLQGRRVAKPTKGLYIINGKKRVGRKTMLVE